MSWFEKLLPKVSTAKKKGVPEGVWSQCEGCQATLYQAELENNLRVCIKCNYHIRLSGRQRLESFLDLEERTELGHHIRAKDWLKFRDSKRYRDRLAAAHKSAGEKEALIVMSGFLQSIPVIAASFDFNFIGGSMSAAVGERFVAGVQAALDQKISFVCFSTSGGARMQEGLFSLFQMAKTSAILTRLTQAGVPYISVLTDPTMGGVSASLAMLGDVIIAEPGALIGFSGPRVIEQTIREKLPEGFQRSEFLLKHGAIDMIVDRRQMRSKIARILAKLTNVKEPCAC